MDSVKIVYSIARILNFKVPKVIKKLYKNINDYNNFTLNINRYQLSLLFIWLLKTRLKKIKLKNEKSTP